MERKPHIAFDLNSRELKAQKIEKLLDLSKRQDPINLLEIGTGAGGIAHYFAQHKTIKFVVCAVDVVDQRQLKENYSFHLVKDTFLPFDNESFDVVISNHVIEHVGNSDAQLHHLKEIKRVMRIGAKGYLAVPNRWMVVEPHYRLVFLSWWPESMRHTYLKLFKKGDYYDCNPLTKKRLEKYLINLNFKYENLCAKALKKTLEIETNHSIIAKTAGKLPVGLLDRMSWISPTLIFKLFKV